MEIFKDEKKLRLDIAKSIIENLYNINISEKNLYLKNELKENIVKRFSFSNIPNFIEELTRLQNISKKEKENEYEKFVIAIIDSFNSINETIIYKKNDNINKESLSIKEKLNEIEKKVNSGLDLNFLKSELLNISLGINNELKTIENKYKTIEENNEALINSLKIEIENMNKALLTLNKDLEDSIENSKIDLLTEVNNRKSYENIVSKIDLFKEDNVSLIVCDIDNFKDLNDKYGHTAGDGALKCISNILKSNISNPNLIFRYGGEEFVIIVKDSNSSKAYNKAERLRKKIEETSFYYKEERVKITCSFGVSQKEYVSESMKDVFIRADKLLYESKKSGKNKVSY